jgi:hypothetical protein
MSVIYTGPAGGLYVKGITDVLGIGATINAAGQFVASTGPEIRRVTASPNGTISDFGGSLALDVTNGVVYVNTTTGNIAGTSWAVVSTSISGSSGVSRVFALISSIADQGENSAALVTPAGVQFTIPANTLKASSTLQVRLAANMNQGAGARTVTLSMTLGATSLVSISGVGFADNTALLFDFNSTIRAAGAAVTAASSISGEASVASFAAQLVSAGTINTTVANVLSFNLQMSGASAATNMDITEYELYLSV